MIQPISTLIYVTTRFAAYHRWKDAPHEVAFLRNWHRHLFHVKVSLRVSHNQRELEFFMMQHSLILFVRRTFEEKKFELSCEDIAQQIAEFFVQYGEGVLAEVEVSEDGENGAILYFKGEG